MKNLLTRITLLAIALIGIALFPTDPYVMTGALLGSIAASSTQSFTIPYCPQYITFNIATVPTSINVNVEGFGISMNLASGALITEINGWRKQGVIANEYTFPMSDGFIQRNTTFTIANAHAAQLDVYGWSTEKGLNMFEYSSETIIANSGTVFDDFAALAIDSLAAFATDNVTITYQDGQVSVVGNDEVLAYSQYFANTVTDNVIDNLDQNIASVLVNAAANRNAVKVSLAGI